MVLISEHRLKFKRIQTNTLYYIIKRLRLKLYNIYSNSFATYYVKLLCDLHHHNAKPHFHFLCTVPTLSHTQAAPEIWYVQTTNVLFHIFYVMLIFVLIIILILF